MTVESELEAQKTAKIGEIAEYGAKIAPQLHADPEQVGAFLAHYFRHVDDDDVVDRSAEDLIDLVTCHYKLALKRPAARANVTVMEPDDTVKGWPHGDAVIQIVNDDRPFLVDTVSMEILRQGWNIREVYHPQFTVKRDIEGTLEAVVHTNAAFTDPSVLRESWIHIEAVPPTEAGDDAADRLREGMLQVLRDVEEAVEDWTRMSGKADETISLLQSASLPVSEYERDNAIDLLTWLRNNNFTFLGYREYALIPATEGKYRYRFEPVRATGLGILRHDTDVPGSFHAYPTADHTPALVVVTKDNFKSPVHRPAYMDYIGVRVFGADGQVVGERRFLGLFSASAYSESVMRIPALRVKTEEVLRRSGYDRDSHGAKAIQSVVETMPRDELFQAKASVLGPVIERISRLKERRQVRMFVRADAYGRYASCLVFLPRDRYTTGVRLKMEQVLLDHFGGESVEYEARVSESVLARLHFIVRMPAGEPLCEVDVSQVEAALTRATRSWSDDFGDELSGQTATRAALGAVVSHLPEGYKENFSARHAVMDLEALRALQGDDALSMALYVPDDDNDEADLRMKVFRRGESMSLSEVLPHLSLLGVKVVDERPYDLGELGSARALIYDFGLQVPGGSEGLSHWDDSARDRFTEAFGASWDGRAEADSLNGLVTAAGLNWRQVSWLRTISRYLQQAGTPHSQSYIAQALLANVEISALLVELFVAKFDPSIDHRDLDSRSTAMEAAREKVVLALDDVASLDHDRIIRSFLAVIDASIRTNAFRDDARAMSIKVVPSRLPDLPAPRPAYEIFVCSPRLEGVHLRFGGVARGGLRWSDRAEDFRTEVLGLVKAQMVKNTVIVPVGAKGGFYAKRLPDPAADREAWLQEGKSCYQIFINSLLDVTDNIVESKIVPPNDVVRFDGDDPYLVVAADKGTATFSDLANSISTERGFWLDDAFASGGSVGYDHKGMGITARGAWESVRRHFREMGVDSQNEDFTCVGVGDMAGDVFGNGMLLSKHIRLVAAFNHQHIFVDPDPDSATGWEERHRLFNLPRSSWSDYNVELLSAGGGIHSRSAKSIEITEQVREALGLDASVTSLAPAALINAILKAPVDLLWNGGIGTYIKAAEETNVQVGDKANDAVRVNGTDLRCRAVGEGGNLGATQLGRIEYARAGGRINTDFIDNSAGVDTSDHEVNIKILLAAEVKAGRLEEEGRRELLASMTDEVADLVLAHNYDQNLALANGLHQAASMAGVHERWMQKLVDLGSLDREIEFLPETDEMEARMAASEGLSGPEMSTLLAYTKIYLEREVLASDLPDDPYLADRLVQYFPSQLREKYAEVMPEHRLHREIITTVAVNRFVNSSGITSYYRLAEEAGSRPADVIRAQLAARSIFRCGLHEVQTQKLDNLIDAEVQTDVRMQFRNLVERGTRWLLHNRRTPIDVQGAIDQFVDGVQEIKANLSGLIVGRDAEAFNERYESFAQKGVPEDLARVVAGTGHLFQALGIVQTAQQLDADVMTVARTHFHLGQRLGLDLLATKIAALPRQDEWESMARAALRDDLLQVHVALTGQATAMAAATQGSGDSVTSGATESATESDTGSATESGSETEDVSAASSVGQPGEEHSAETGAPGSESAGSESAGSESAESESAESELVEAWARAVEVDETTSTLDRVCDGAPDLAKLSVGLRTVRSLLSTQN